MPRPYSYRIRLADVAPVGDPEWDLASVATRAEVLRWVQVLGLKEKEADLAKGLDKNGRPLKRVATATAEHRKSEMGPADPKAPALMPAYAVSRTRLLLDASPTRRADAVEFFWGHDAYTGASWGRILDFHRRGAGRLPVRDVIGISPAALARVRAEVLRRWKLHKRGLPTTPARQRTPVPSVRTIGRTDWRNATFGIGAGGPPGPGVQTTGMFVWRPGRGITAFGGPETAEQVLARLPDWTRQPRAFVKEVARLLAEGRKLPKAVMRLYERLKGRRP